MGGIQVLQLKKSAHNYRPEGVIVLECTTF
jgi:hypothetical protein